MDTSPESDLDRYVARLADGRTVTTDELAPLVYEDLHRIAHKLFQRERPGITLQPTALVHEAFMHLADQSDQSWESRAHFLAVAATAMRRVLIDAARSRGRGKRGGSWERVTLSGSDADDSFRREIDLIDLDDTLRQLAEVNQRYVRIVELRYFAGLSLEEVAKVLGVSRTIIVREWAKARSWLVIELEDRAADRE